MFRDEKVLEKNLSISVLVDLSLPLMHEIQMLPLTGSSYVARMSIYAAAALAP